MHSPRSRSHALYRVLGSFTHALAIFALAFGEIGFAPAVRAQETASEPAPASDVLSAADLESLVGPIALYPDELIAITLPASTYPLEIVQAARLLEKRKTQPDAAPDESWDASVLGLMNYPEVIKLMNDDLNWTWKLGEAVANQPDDVMAAVQSFRAKVDAAGNLESNEQVTVVRETQESQQIIVIESASPEVIYVPQYQPTVVVAPQPAPYPYYYSPPYPYYYSPAAAFWTGMFVGAAIGYGCSWGYGHSHISYNSNVNVNVDRPTRPSTPNRPGGDFDRPSGDRPGGERPGAGGSGGGDRWKPDPNRGKAGGRPGTANRPSTGSAQRPSAGARPSTGAAQRPSSSARPSAGTTRPGGSTASPSRSLTTQGGRGSSRGSSLGSYGSAGESRSYGSRGASSRGGGGGGRGGGGGGRGGVGGRR